MTSAPLYNEEIEQALLASLLASDRAYEYAEGLRPEHFYSPVHGRIYQTIQSIHGAGRSVTASTVAPYFVNDPDLTNAGGAQFIRDLAGSCIATTSTRAHAEEIKFLHSRRMLRSLASDLIYLADNPALDMSPQELMAQVEKTIHEAEEHVSVNSVRHISEFTQGALDDMRDPRAGIRSGIPAVDAMTRGFLPGALYIIAGRPGMGKTTLGLTFALNAAIAGRKTLFTSLEMPGQELIKRMFSRLTGSAMHSGGFIEEIAATSAKDELDKLPFFLNERSTLTGTAIALEARRQKRKKGLEILFVDYLGLIASEDKRANKVHQIEEITTGLKRLAKEMEIPVVLLCQLSRALEGREDKRPQLSDLRDSGSIEQDADVVMFIYRAEYYIERGKPEESRYTTAAKRMDAEADWRAMLDASRGKAEIIVAKVRQGKIGTANVKFDGARQVFHD